jgi:hypothetical protein
MAPAVASLNRIATARGCRICHPRYQLRSGSRRPRPPAKPHHHQHWRAPSRPPSMRVREVPLSPALRGLYLAALASESEGRGGKAEGAGGAIVAQSPTGGRASKASFFMSLDTFLWGSIWILVSRDKSLVVTSRISALVNSWVS